LGFLDRGVSWTDVLFEFMGNSDSRALAKATEDLKDAGAPADILKSHLHRAFIVTLGT